MTFLDASLGANALQKGDKDFVHVSIDIGCRLKNSVYMHHEVLEEHLCSR